MSINRRFAWVVVAASFLAVGGCGSTTTVQPSPGVTVVDPAAIEASIRSMDKDWNSAVAAKDADKAASFYADDGQLLEPGAPPAVGKDAVHKMWAGLVSSPNFGSLTFEPSTVKVATAGDLAYEIGTYQMEMKDPKGKPTVEKGKYVVIWKKQADGAWKVEVDTDNPGL
jgi:uncharacterized protein (TIGR02246 family)